MRGVPGTGGVVEAASTTAAGAEFLVTGSVIRIRVNPVRDSSVK